MFAELVTPEVAIGRSLADPVFVHVRKEVELAEGREESADAGACVGWDRGAGGGAGCGIGFSCRRRRRGGRLAVSHFIISSVL